MTEYAIIFQVLAALVALFFIFLTYMNTKTWKWVHVTMTFMVFAAAIAFCFYAAAALKTRAAWIKLHDGLEKDVETTAQQLELLTRGDPRDVEGKTPSIASLREELSRTIIDRGRVWRGCPPQAFDPGRGTATVLTTPPPDPNLPPPPPKKNNIQVKTVLHAFREALTTAGLSVPVAYIGEFEATAVTDNSVTMSATMPLSADQAAAAGAPPVTWALYETCPVDGHEWFTGMNNQAALETMIPGNKQDPAYQKMIQSYVRDGQRAEDTDPPENVWFEVKFLRQHVVVVDAPAAGTSLDASSDLFPFNADGQAVPERLRRRNPAGPVTFGPGPGQIQTAILDQQTAEPLVSAGIAEKIRPIYRRKLNDYEQRLHAIYLRTLDINGRVRQLTIDDQTTVATTTKANQQSMLVAELKTKLTDDLTKAQFEQSELKKYSDAIEARLAAVQTQLSELYKSNKAISRELVKLNNDLTSEIERRTRESTAKSP
ncbi:MAG TPA: hypothetical protein VFB80_18570 [Pirellulaceae bacterium]|nr:hypothetical protein [Pirellulaceae bacterium]